MLTLSNYKKKLFYIVAFSMIVIASMVMAFGYVVSKKSTMATMEQSANIEIKLKKEILLQVIEQTSKAIATLKRFEISDDLFANKSVSIKNFELLKHMFKVNIDLLGFRCLDDSENVLCHYYKDTDGQISKIHHSEKLVKYHLGNDLSNMYQEVFIVDLRVLGNQTILSIATFVESDKINDKNIIIVDVDISQWMELYLDSMLFEIAILNEDGNILKSSDGIANNKAYFLKAIKTIKSSKYNWQDGYMYKSQSLFKTTHSNFDVYFQSKANLSEITKGMVRIFLTIFALIIPISVLISYTLTRAHVSLIQRVISREDLIAQESKMLELGSMISFLAHQWRQPINTISTGLMLLSQRLEEKKEKELLTKLDEIELLVQDLGDDIETFRDLYRFSKIKELFWIKKSLVDVVKILSPQLKLYQINLKYPLEDAKVYGYKNEWKHALLSIMNNIIEAYANSPTLEQRDIAFNIKKEHDGIILFIKDNAGGIDSRIKEKIFDKYSTTKSSNFGTGLGLYFAKVIIEERLGGKLSFETSTKGTIFMIKHKALID